MSKGTNKNNYISIAKALGITLMVVGHSGCPMPLANFLYMFHIPLFFVCSGIFFKEVTDCGKLSGFILRRLNGLYLPYIKWSLLFLILHNTFCSIKVYNGLVGQHPYSSHEFMVKLLKAVFMSDYELLIRPFWFLKELLLASLLVALMSLIRNRLFPIVSNILLLFLMLSLTVVSKYAEFSLPAIGDGSILSSSMAYLYSGIVYKEFKMHIPLSTYMLLSCLLVTIAGSLFLTGSHDMRYTTYCEFPWYYFCSLAGILMTLCISVKLNQSRFASAFHYIGNNTMPILALNLLALKAASLVKIWILGMPIEHLADYTCIIIHNTWFWVVYACAGMLLPLAVNMLYVKIFIKK